MGRARRILRRSLLAVCALPLALALGVWVGSFAVGFPDDLTEAPAEGRRILDRDGRLLARTMADDKVFRVYLRIEDAGSDLRQAMLAAEDQRFRSHSGIDFLAVARAAAQAVWQRKLVSGASTITQQLARSTFDRPRTLTGKLQEMMVALAIERNLSKDRILEEYLNRVHFGPNLVGARAASDHYFGKPLAALDLSETATLAALVRGPSLYDPRVRPAAARRERDRVLRRMREEGWIDQTRFDRALALPVLTRDHKPLPGAQHWVRAVAGTTERRVVHSTLLSPLQNDVEELVANRRLALDSREATAAAVLVLDNATGEVLAYVGSPDFDNVTDGGQNDGVRALRQPGSTLKPFVYALGIDALNMGPATLIVDEPTHFRTPDSFYAPKNFDRKFRGEVTVRRALANSLNVPAVAVLDKLGTHNVLSKLHELGIVSLDRDPSFYGPALALGDGEITLAELTTAYAALARGGITVERKLTREPAAAIPAAAGMDAAPGASTATGSDATSGAAAHGPRRVFSAEAAALVTEILSDDASRRETFGGSNALDLRFAVAAKTGTSKGYRDSWTVGYTRKITVGVWVGNFDGRPTDRLTGARGAAPLWGSVMKAVVQHLGPEATAPGRERPLHDVALEQRPVCLNDDESEGCCSPRILEWFAPERRTPVRHLARARRGPASTEEGPRVAFPRDGMRFQYDPAIPPERQRLVLRAATSLTAEADAVTLLLNGRDLPTRGGEAEWPLAKGHYELAARDAVGRTSPAVAFFVE